MKMLTPVLNISTDDTSGQFANIIQILEKSLDTLMEESKNNTQLIIDRFDDTASSRIDTVSSRIDTASPRIDTHKEEHVVSDDNVEANNGTKKTYASIVNEGKPHMVEAMESRVIKNKDRRSNWPLHGTAP